MMTSGKITGRQLGSILFLIRALPITMTFPMMIGMPSPRGLWLVAIASTLVSLPLLVWMAWLSGAEGLESITQISRRCLGRVGGGVIGWALVFYWIFLAALELRAVGEAYVLGTMPDTPLVVFMVLTALVSAGIGRRGVKLIAQMSELTAALILLGLVLTVVLPEDLMEFRNLLPLFPERLSSLLVPAGTAIALFLSLNEFLMIAPYMKSRGDLMRGTVYSALASGVVLTLFTVAVVAVFGPLSTSLELPALSLTRVISLGTFFERAELITVASWTLGAGLALATLLWTAAKASAELLGLTRYEPLVYPIGGLAVVMGVRMWPDIGTSDRSISVARGGLVPALFVVAVLVLLTGVRAFRRRKSSGGGGGRLAAGILALCLTVSLATGCWSHREIESLAFVMAVGVDNAIGVTPWQSKGLEGDAGKHLQVTVQVVKPVAMATAERGAPSERPFWTVSATGETLIESIRNLAELSPRRLFWPHNRWVVFGEEFAKTGVSKAFDLLLRDQETRRRSIVGVVFAGRAWDLLQAEFELERLPSEGGRAILMNASRSLSTVVQTTLNEFSIALASEGIDPIASRVEVVPYVFPYEITGELLREQIKSVAKLTGAAVFRDDKLVGWLDGRQTRGYNWITGKVKSGILVVEAPEPNVELNAPWSRIGVEIIRSGATFKPKIEANRREIGMEIRVWAETHIADVQPYVNLYEHPGLWEEIERRAAEAIRGETLAAIRQAQELKADIFGFGREVYRTNPKLWKQVKSEWYDIFAAMEPEIEVKVEVVRSGLTVRGVQVDKMGEPAEAR